MSVRRSSRRSIVNDKEESSAKSAYVAKRQYNKKNDVVKEPEVETKKPKKNNIVAIVDNQKKSNEKELKTKPLNIRLYRLQESKGDYSQDDIAETKKMSKEEKNLLFNKKKGKTLVPLQKGVKKRSGRPKGKGGKFQIKIKDTEADESDKDQAEEEEAYDEDERPDSGFSSRAGTDTPRSLSESPAKDDAEELNEDMEKENQRFLAELDEGLSSEEEEESDWDGDSDDGFKKAAKKPAKKSKKLKKTAAALNAPIVMPGALKGELSEYEKVRAGNIKDRQDMLAALMADFADFKKDSGLGGQKKEVVKRVRKEKIEYNPDQLRRSTRQSIKPEDKEKLGSERWDVDTGDRHRIAEQYSDYDSDDYEIYEKRKGATKKFGGRGNTKDPNEDILMPEDITETMLSKVADRFGQKVYDQVIGTSCHQCRQKTVDMKTICRSGRCRGVQGQFCGRCLEIRYGESAREALLDPEWACPPCRGFCNCSICRNRSGKGATGILIHLAQNKGFKSVADYLKDLRKKTGQDNYDED